MSSSTRKIEVQPARDIPSQADETRRLYVIVTGLLAVGAAAVWWFLAGFFFSVRCDESCYDTLGARFRTDDHWYNYNGAWQWYLEFGLAWVGVITAALAIRYALQANYSRSYKFLAATVGLFVVWLFVSQGLLFD